MRARFSLIPFALLLGIFLFLPKNAFAESWTNIGPGLVSPGVVAADLGNKNHLLVTNQASLGPELDYTYDAGKTWTKSSISGTPCTEIEQSPKVHTEWWAACSGGLFHSADDGKNFALTRPFTNHDMHISIANDGYIYLNSGNQEAHSADGIIWSWGNFPNNSSYNAYVVADPNNSSTAYISRTGTGAGLYRTSDGGAHWDLISTMWEFRSGISGMFVMKNGVLCAINNVEGVSYSTNGGMTWGRFVTPDPVVVGESNRIYSAFQNHDDLDNILISNVGMNDSSPRLYSTEGTDTTKTKTYTLPWPRRGGSVSQGVVFLSVGNPTSAAGVWSSDGIATKVEVATKYPIIIVPGILGSWNVPGQGWRLDPVFHTYDGLITNLENVGYEDGKTLFTFPYQWRNDNKVSAQLLKQKIDEAKAISGAPKVVIIAHSMGGIVTRFYLEGDNYGNDVDKVFFLGTPQLGSVDSYFLWEGGSVDYLEPAEVRLFLKFVLSEESLSNGFFGDQGVLNYIHNQVTSIKQLLPIFQYKENGVVSAPTNNDLSDLNSKVSLITSRGIRVVNITSDYGSHTIRSMRTVPTNDPFLWIDGMPDGYGSPDIYKGISFGNGDNSVLLESQAAVPGITYQHSNVSHIEIPNNSAEDIFKELGVNKQALVTETINKYLIVKAYSPVAFDIISPSGKKIGQNISEIPGAFYSGSDSAAQFVIIPNPENGQYSIGTTGTGSGEYKIESTFLDESKNQENTQAYTGTTSLGSEQTILTNLDTTTGTVTAKVNDNLPPVTSLQVVGGEQQFYKDDVTVSLSSTDDISGVKEINYSTDGTTWQSYTGPVSVSGEGKKDIYYRSTDYAGNVEYTQKYSFTIDKTAPEMTVSLNKTTFSRWEKLNLSCSASDRISGVKVSSIQIDGNSITCQNQVLDLSGYQLGTHSVEYNATDNAVNTVSGKLSFAIIATTSSAQLDLADLYNHHFLDRGEYLYYSISLSVADLLNHFHLISSRNNIMNEMLKHLELNKRLKKITDNAYNLIKEDLLWLKNNH